MKEPTKLWRPKGVNLLAVGPNDNPCEELGELGDCCGMSCSDCLLSEVNRDAFIAEQDNIRAAATGAEVNRKRVAELEAELEEAHKEIGQLRESCETWCEAKSLDQHTAELQGKVCQLLAANTELEAELALERKKVHVLATYQLSCPMEKNVVCTNHNTCIECWTDYATTKAKETD